jgi:peptidoglycan-associated lipoprotein
MYSRRLLPLILALALPLGCAKKTADIELDAAEAAARAARNKKANDCAKETFQAAEAAIAEAKAKQAEGDIEAAKQKANEAKALYEQASAASKPGCNEPPKPEEDPNANAQTNNASTGMKIEDALQTVYFDYNDASIREDSKAMLSKVAGGLANNAAIKIEIEGHCDVRGSTEYNLQLGERRARAVQKYLTTQGVKPEQLEVISYGEERPIDLGGTEDAHQKNRRAELKKAP